MVLIEHRDDSSGAGIERTSDTRPREKIRLPRFPNRYLESVCNLSSTIDSHSRMHAVRRGVRENDIRNDGYEEE